MQTQEYSNASSAYLPSYDSRFEVKITQDRDELNQARKLRLGSSNAAASEEVFKQNAGSNTKRLIEQQKLLLHDGYDSFSQHLIIKDLDKEKVIAYVRIIDAFTAFNIGGFYCETQFNMQRILNNQQNYMEISRLVIDANYENKQIAQLIWSGIYQYAFEKGADAIIGTLSVPLHDNISDTSKLIAYYKSRYISNNTIRVVPYQLLPGMSKVGRKFSTKKFNVPQVDYFFSKGVLMCGDAYWNKDLNTADLFIHYKVTNTPQVPYCIHINEVELGLLCEG
ncbi:MAG: GNAT family N-acyltransferase [Gammaproteobacteria bacterium]|nr:GNAT family N-acyltransferase [Gammaproteobacteria bacterium]